MDLETKVKSLTGGSADSEWLLTAEYMMGQSTDGRLSGSISEVNGIVGFVTDPSKSTQRPLSMQVSCGSAHTCGVISDGRIECFGSNDNGQSNAGIPVSASSGRFVQVSAGPRHTCGLTNEGLIECFGGFDSVKIKKASTGQFTQVSAGPKHTCGVVTDGFIECFDFKSNKNQNSGIRKYASSGHFVQVSTGDHYICGVTTERKIECFDNELNGGKQHKATLQEFIQVSASPGSNHFCGLTARGSIKCFGATNSGTNQGKPKSAFSGHFKQVSTGPTHTCGVTTNGFIECFGSDKYGESNGFLPKKASTGLFVQVASTGEAHTCGLTTAGFIECFGYDGYGRSAMRVPKKGPMVPFVQVSSGSSHTCTLTKLGAIECFGNSKYGRTNWGKPKKARSGYFSQISSFLYLTCGLSVGAIECFGSDSSKKEESIDVNPRTASSGHYNQVAVGDSHACGLTSKGMIQCFTASKTGKKDWDGIRRATKGRFLQVSSSKGRTCGLTSEKSIECFTAKTHPKKYLAGQFTQVSAGSSFVCGLTKEGLIQCDKKTMLLTEGSSEKFKQIAAGSEHVCGVTTKGVIQCFGSNIHNKINNGKPFFPPYGTTFVNVSCGHTNTCGLLSSGGILCFGSDNNGQSNNYEVKMPMSRYFLPSTCYLRREKYIDCEWNRGIFVEAGILVNTDSARTVIGGIVGGKVVLDKFIVEKQGNKINIAGLSSHIRNIAASKYVMPYGLIRNWNPQITKRKKKRRRRLMTVNHTGLPKKTFLNILGAIKQELRKELGEKFETEKQELRKALKAIPVLQSQNAQTAKKLKGVAMNKEVKKLAKDMKAIPVLQSQNAQTAEKLEGVAMKKEVQQLVKKEVNKKMIAATTKKEKNINSEDFKALKAQNSLLVKEIKTLSGEVSGLQTKLKSEKARTTAIETVFNSLRKNRPYPKKLSPYRKCAKIITPRWYSELLSDDRRREVAGCVTTAVNLDLENTNAVDIKDLALDGGVAVHEEVALLELGSPQEVLDKQFVYKVEGRAPFLKESDLIYNFMTKQTEAVYDCKTTAKQVCSASEHSQKQTSLTVVVYEDKEWCCGSSSHSTCGDSCKLEHPRRYTVKVTGTKYEIHDDQHRRRLLVKRFRGGGGS
jgi:alpha-tubulin suppressor-like RCC1 family protein